MMRLLDSAISSQSSQQPTFYLGLCVKGAGWVWEPPPLPAPGGRVTILTMETVFSLAGRADGTRGRHGTHQPAAVQRR